MNQIFGQKDVFSSIDTGLLALRGVAAYYRIAVDPKQIQHDLALKDRLAGEDDLVLAAKQVGLKARCITRFDAQRLAKAPLPAIVRWKSGTFAILVARNQNGSMRLIDPLTRIYRELRPADLITEIEPALLLVTRRFGGKGIEPRSFGFQWFLPSMWRYRKPLGHVLLASFFVQIFALITPLFFQVVIDKVLTHKAQSTLIVLVLGLLLIGVFDVVLQYLRTYALAHSANRIDVELGRRLFQQLMRLPLSYFEARPAGQTVARVRELENIRSFLTGQALFSVIDLFFTVIFFAVLFAYSPTLTWIIVATIPIYLTIGFSVRPLLRSKINDKYNSGAASQQFLVETIVGAATVKASAVEPIMQAQWEERLAAYVKTGFEATMLGATGQNAISYVSKVTAALVLFFGARAVMEGDLTIGALVAFNMISAQAIQPILRLSQLWQDFQQVQVSVERLGDILNHPAEVTRTSMASLPRPRGDIEIKHVSFRYQPGTAETMKDVSLTIKAGEVIGVVGPSGSGKSTLSKLLQRLYVPESGSILLDGNDLTTLDPSWLRSHIGVVLQDNLLFNRSVHENIAFATPAMPRGEVIALAKLTGADEFIARLPQGYDTIIEERGANLSGGQRQRIAIARALAADPPILIFDEATSALDYESERLVQANMKRMCKNRTVLIIAHRLAAVRDCDRIIGVVDGRIVESGTHDSLLHNPAGLYARLWALQNEKIAS